MAVSEEPVVYKASDGSEFEDKDKAVKHDALVLAKRDYEQALQTLIRLVAQTQKTADGFPFEPRLLRDYYYISVHGGGVQPRIGKVDFWGHNWSLSDPRGEDAEVQIYRYGENNHGVSQVHRFSELYREEANAHAAWLVKFREWVAEQNRRLLEEESKTPEGKKERYWRWFLESGLYGPQFTAKRLQKVKPLAWADRELWADMKRHGYPDDPSELDDHGRGNWVGIIGQIMIQHGILKG